MKVRYSKRHYQDAASIFAILRANEPSTEELGMLEEVEEEFILLFKDDNPQFNRERFIKACKGE